MLIDNPSIYEGEDVFRSPPLIEIMHIVNYYVEVVQSILKLPIKYSTHDNQFVEIYDFISFPEKKLKKQAHLYIYYCNNEERQPLYIGITQDFLARMVSHLYKSLIRPTNPMPIYSVFNFVRHKIESVRVHANNCRLHSPADVRRMLHFELNNNHWSVRAKISGKYNCDFSAAADCIKYSQYNVICLTFEKEFYFLAMLLEEAILILCNQAKNEIPLNIRKGHEIHDITRTKIFPRHTNWLSKRQKKSIIQCHKNIITMGSLKQ